MSGLCANSILKHGVGWFRFCFCLVTYIPIRLILSVSNFFTYLIVSLQEVFVGYTGLGWADKQKFNINRR